MYGLRWAKEGEGTCLGALGRLAGSGEVSDGRRQLMQAGGVKGGWGDGVVGVEGCGDGDAWDRVEDEHECVGPPDYSVIAHRLQYDCVSLLRKRGVEIRNSP